MVIKNLLIMMSLTLCATYFYYWVSIIRKSGLIHNVSVSFSDVLFINTVSNSLAYHFSSSAKWITLANISDTFHTFIWVVVSYDVIYLLKSCFEECCDVHAMEISIAIGYCCILGNINETSFSRATVTTWIFRSKMLFIHLNLMQKLCVPEVDNGRKDISSIDKLDELKTINCRNYIFRF